MNDRVSDFLEVVELFLRAIGRIEGLHSNTLLRMNRIFDRLLDHGPIAG
jgi:hypothetical protein